MIRISRNKDVNNIHDFMFDVMVIGIGSSSSSSSSSTVSPLKIVKITVIKKNHGENGSYSLSIEDCQDYCD